VDKIRSSTEAQDAVLIREGEGQRETEREKVVKTTRSHRKKNSGKQPKKIGEWKGARFT